VSHEQLELFASTGRAVAEVRIFNLKCFNQWLNPEIAHLPGDFILLRNQKDDVLFHREAT
jgi:hypothetical protein